MTVAGSAQISFGGAAPPLPVSPLHQLPSPPADFTGREAELADLRKAVEQGGATISGLRGMAGVGKTALALKLAEQLKPLFPDAQLYLDLKGVSSTPLFPTQAMSHVVRSYYPDAQLPERQEELAALYRSVLNGKRALLLMDNAAGREQVESLIPPKGCLLLVTSRFHFHLPGLLTRDLDELSPEEAKKLLLKIEPRIGESAAELAGLCGRLPIALRLAGAALTERPDLSPATYVERLKDARKLLDLVEASFTLSYDLLPEDLQKRWRELAVFPGSFDLKAAAAVWAMEPEPADDMLGALLKSSLVDGEDGRYRLHDLARVFAASRLEEAERAEARRRHAEHYAWVLAAANFLYLKGGDSVLVGLRLYDLEWGNIQAGFAWAAEGAKADEAAARLCSRYLDAGADCLDLRQPKRERIQWLESALAAARQLGDRSAEGRHLGNLGIAYKNLGDARRATDHYEQVLQIARETGDRRGEGSALGNLGNAYAKLGDARRATEHYEQHLQIAREIGDRRGEGNALGNLGNAYAGLGDVRRAIEHFEQVLQIAQETGDRRGEGQTFGNLGNAYAELGDVRRAIEHHEQRLQIAREIGDRAGEARGSWNLGLLYEAEDDLERAVELMQRQVEYAREIGHQEAEKWAARVDAIRARIQETPSRPKKAPKKKRPTSQPRSGDRI
ncbi:MAG TPA: tetratricopeptide repeat protein [Thermoanaerobaculia bacterium]|nr:tetratricopeptide repeat protein [Thermoanaerobaculia bacterium]